MGGSSLSLQGKMFELLKGVYERSERECDVAISFNQATSGVQVNACRTLLVGYAADPRLETGALLAQRLADVTDGRSRIGLLFLILGKEGLDHKIIVSRFPADSGVLADLSGGTLNVEFLERIFMKSAKAYKAAVYRHSSLTGGFWKGFVVDRQMNDADINASRYWISDFLDSDFLTTSQAGTRRLAIACKNAARNSNDVRVKSEIVAAVTLAAGRDGQQLSAKEFVTHAGLSDAAKRAILGEIKPHLHNERFRFKFSEFSGYVTYRSIKLSNGAILTAETGEFDEIFEERVLDELEGTRRYTTEGKVVDEKIGKTVQ